MHVKCNRKQTQNQLKKPSVIVLVALFELGFIMNSKQHIVCIYNYK